MTSSSVAARAPAGLALENELPRRLSAPTNRSVVDGDLHRNTEYQWSTTDVEEQVSLRTSASSRHVKRGHRCCGWGCDMRRAVVLLNVLNILLLMLLSLDGSVSYEDILLMISSAVGLVGAVTYSWPGVGVTAAVYAFFVGHALVLDQDLCRVLDQDLWRLGTCLFFLYPHVVLCRELWSGIMSRENYSMEQATCCGWGDARRRHGPFNEDDDMIP